MANLSAGSDKLEMKLYFEISAHQGNLSVIQLAQFLNNYGFRTVAFDNCVYCQGLWVVPTPNREALAQLWIRKPTLAQTPTVSGNGTYWPVYEDRVKMDLHFEATDNYVLVGICSLAAYPPIPRGECETGVGILEQRVAAFKNPRLHTKVGIIAGDPGHAYLLVFDDQGNVVAIDNYLGVIRPTAANAKYYYNPAFVLDSSRDLWLVDVVIHDR